MELSKTSVPLDWQQTYQIGNSGPVPALQVRQRWDDTVLDVRHMRPSAEQVEVGASLGWRWELLGVDMGWVPEPMHKVLPYAPPMWSEVHQRAKQDFYADEEALLGAEGHTLFRWVPDVGWVARVMGHWTVKRDGEVVDLKAGQSDLILGETTLQLHIGTLYFDAVVVPAANRAARSPWLLDAPMLASAGMMSAVGLGFGLIVAFAPPPLTTSVFENDSDAMEVMMLLPKAEPVVEQEPKPVEKSKNTKKKRKEDLRPSRRTQGDGPKGDSKKAADMKEVAASGLFASGAFDALDNVAGIDSELRGFAGRLTSKAGGGVGDGMYGLGQRGDSLGRGLGTESIGGIDVFGGDGSPGGDGCGDKTLADGDGGGKDIVTIGQLGAHEVDEVIKHHLSAIRYCYQRQLTQSPNLGGKISMHFTIAGDGSVSKAKVRTSTMGNSTVESCITNRFLKMEFPTPRGGGIVLVNYPFLFTPG
ncbi:MAG: AgmX/PglI C-terminal domain-containing protein [Rhodobacterales bacterium]|nr:AgmX/PglI C-terminal domain-containing protein [Rhodobacterales bacterium]